MRIHTLISLLVLTICSQLSAAELSLLLKSGATIAGNLVEKSETQARVETQYGEITIKRENFTEESWNKVLKAKPSPRRKSFAIYQPQPYSEDRKLHGAGDPKKEREAKEKAKQKERRETPNKRKPKIEDEDESEDVEKKEKPKVIPVKPKTEADSKGAAIKPIKPPTLQPLKAPAKAA